MTCNSARSVSVCLVTILWELHLRPCLADNSMNERFAQEISGESGEQRFLVTTEEGDEILAALGFLFSMILFLFAMSMAYFSVLEDCLMQSFQQLGVDLRATVLDASFLRGASVALWNGKHSSPSMNEYCVLIEYSPPSSGTVEKRTIIKQVKALECDLTESPSVPRAIQVQFDGFEEPCASMQSFDSFCSGRHNTGLDILVLPDYPRSGIPRRQAERACSLRYRLPTVLFILVLISMAILFIYIGVNNIPNLSLDSSAATAYATVFLLAAELCCVHCFFGNQLRESLNEMYLEGGEFVSPSLAAESSTSSEDYN